MRVYALSTSENRPGQLDRECGTRGDPLPSRSRSDRKHRTDACRRLAGRVDSVHRLKSGSMSVVIHMGDCGFRHGDMIKLGEEK